MPLAFRTTAPAVPAVFSAVTLSAAPCGSLSLASTFTIMAVVALVVAVPGVVTGGNQIPVTTTVSVVAAEKP